ncbi:MAG: rod shape-determining protein MreD [Candidatus Omnitrophica bacterium]|nr:rod shape-determining protein MreD [Candidatus Omnitrophota bacterium]
MKSDHFKRHALSYTLLLSAFLAVTPAKWAVWVPDLLLLLVVFTASFCGLRDGIIMSVIAGTFRGIFSYGFIIADIFACLLIVFFVYSLARLLDKESPAMDMIVTGIAFLCLILVDSVSIKIFHESFDGAGGVFSGSWRKLLTTVVAAPIFFQMLNRTFYARRVL